MLTQIQALRAWAALSVVFYHLGGSLASPKYFSFEYLNYFTNFGYSGMLLFFVLSGFIIHQIHASDFGHPERVWRYISKRLFRIFPLYLVLLMLISGFALGTGIGAEGVPKSWQIILATIMLLPQNPEVVGGTGAPIIIVAWSLQYEMVFYAIMALFILDRRIGWAGVLGLTVLWLVLRSGGQDNLFPAFMQLKFFLFFFFGVAASAVSNSRVTTKKAPILVRFALAALASFYVASVVVMVATEGEISLIHKLPIQIIVGIVAAILIVGATAVERSGGRKAGRNVCRLGDWSYAIYLLHFPVISAVSKAVRAADVDVITSAALVVLATLFVTIFASAILHYWVERPGMAVARRSTSA